MSVGFRKGLFGFNCDDVMNYIQNAQKRYSVNESALKREISDLNENISELNKTISAITAERDKMSEKLQEFDSKYEEIDRLAQNIGKLYLVAQSNAHAIMKNSAESDALAAKEIESRMEVIGETEDTLNAIRSEMAEINALFSARIESLTSSLNETKQKLSENKADNNERQENVAAVLQMLEK